MTCSWYTTRILRSKLSPSFMVVDNHSTRTEQQTPENFGFLMFSLVVIPGPRVFYRHPRADVSRPGPSPPPLAAPIVRPGSAGGDRYFYPGRWPRRPGSSVAHRCSVLNNSVVTTPIRIDGVITKKRRRSKLFVPN